MLRSDLSTGFNSVKNNSWNVYSAGDISKICSEIGRWGGGRTTKLQNLGTEGQKKLWKDYRLLKINFLNVFGTDLVQLTQLWPFLNKIVSFVCHHSLTKTEIFIRNLSSQARSKWYKFLIKLLKLFLKIGQTEVTL